ncbi:MAG TPA: hypothetical protein VN841_27625 [Bryobacteraceae bacterium]|nr:hypothetical protein [Bryobacteraceae bacterium]
MLDRAHRLALWIALVCSAAAAAASPPTFYRDVLPILETRCQECHRPGQIAPMAFTTFKETRPWAAAIRKDVLSRRMPPWFADPCCGKFSNDRSLTAAERDTLAEWAATGAGAGDPREAPPPRAWTEGWNIPAPDLVLGPARAFEVPAKGSLDYQYFVVPTGFAQDRWVQASEVRPSARAAVHHAVVYIREPGDTSFPNPTHTPTKADILNVYAPGSAPDVQPPGMAKLIKAGSDLVFEIHYTPTGKRLADRTQIGIQFAAAPPAKRVLTLQMDNTRFLIPPGARDYRVTVWGTLPNDALLVGFFPHMHLRGKEFEYTLVRADGQPETLLRVRPYDFYWQLTYRLAQPRLLKAGTRLEWIATYDNSANNPRNPDPSAEVWYGFQSWEEMMVGFFDVAVDAGVDKKTFFVR